MERDGQQMEASVVCPAFGNLGNVARIASTAMSCI